MLVAARETHVNARDQTQGRSKCAPRSQQATTPERQKARKQPNSVKLDGVCIGSGKSLAGSLPLYPKGYSLPVANGS
jgi:hypothetical protein